MSKQHTKFVEALTFDDVLMTPQLSTLKSRSDVDTSSKLTNNITLNIPIVASNMDTVCESEMAIKMAQLGGIGFIHRYLSIDEQCNEVKKVKNYSDVTINDPYTITEGTNIIKAINLMVEKNVSSLLVVSNEISNEFKGILQLTSLTFENDGNKIVDDFMILVEESIYGHVGISNEEAMEIMKINKIGKLPLLDNNMSVSGLITRKDLFKEQDYPLATRDSQGNLMVGAAVGVHGDYMDRVESLLSVGVDVIVVDIAHGHSSQCIDAIKNIKANFDVDVIAGNVATAQGALDLQNAGADAIKVGVGPGSICTTRIVTGHGVPQLTAILESCTYITIPVIADGGIRKSGDIVKALASGASTVMLGSLLAGTDESPGGFIHRNGTRYKMIRGMASFGAALGRNKRAGDKVSSASPEGVEGFIPYRGSVEEVLSQLMGGVRSGFSYSGAHNIIELWDNAQFVKISSAGLIESNHHDIKAV